VAGRSSGNRGEPELLTGRRPVLESLKAGHPAEKILVARELAPSSTVGEIRRRAEARGVPVLVVPKVEIDRLARGANHQGVAAVTGAYRYADLASILGAPDPAVLFLDGVMDPHNLGSLLRSAEGAGFAGVVISARRASPVTAAARRVSAGASEVLKVARAGNLGRAIDDARSAGLWVVGLEPRASQDLWTSELLAPPVGVVLGSEDRGISAGIRRHCDAFVSIPARGKIGSLNVGSAGAIAMFEVARRRAVDAAG
jgi:23S rRNA (guanosine2251-2'-O)-methyltransferase